MQKYRILSNTWNREIGQIDLRFVSLLLNLSRLRERVVRTLCYHIATSTIDVRWV